MWCFLVGSGLFLIALLPPTDWSSWIPFSGAAAYVALGFAALYKAD